MSAAFHGDAAVRDAALARLAACAAAGRLVPGHVKWSDDKCSAVGCIAGSEDLAVWEERLGLPAWFALVFEAAAGGARDAAAAVVLCTDMLTAIPPGADLDRAGSALILRLLADVAATIAPGGPDPALAEIMQRIVAMHERCLDGQPVDPAQWKAIRRSATALTDTMQDPLQRALARCVESAAWDPQRSRSAALDTLREWRNAYRDKDVLDYGWGADKDAQVQRQLDDLHARYLAGSDDPKGNVFKLFEEHHPEDAAALRAKMAFERENHWRLAALAAPMVLRSLRADYAN